MSLERTYTDLRVLDLSENIAGPLACMILADLGADVVKIERPATGEATRSLPPRWPAADGDESTVFLTVNRNKRSVALDIASPAGRDAVLRIAAGFDVVVESFRPGVAERLGLGFADFARTSPRVVHCSVSAFGEGPLGHDRPGYDAIVQAFSGIMEMTGDPDGLPARAAPSIVDISTGLWATTSIQAALARRATEQGAQRLEATLVDSAFFLMCHQVMGYLGTGEFPGRLGSAAPSTAPYQAFRTADRPIMIAAATDRLFERLCMVLELPDVLTDPRFRSVQARVAARDPLTELIEERLGTAPSTHWLARIQTVGVPCGPVNDLAAALAHPVTAERRMVRAVASERFSGFRQVRLPIDTAGECAMREPPALGQHTEAVLAEAGLTPSEIDALLPRPIPEATVTPR
ncbi:CaiB/BaiF CoA transferase family protein [Pseudonocardia sp. GCM10023141]|uniref:CaiB/BaiF CoA transferase family protein n=1 Tax=Pseudonocardia sp. GCM10023141 TaxID=3252653 RepID=UPI003605E9BB